MFAKILGAIGGSRKHGTSTGGVPHLLATWDARSSVFREHVRDRLDARMPLSKNAEEEFWKRESCGFVAQGSEGKITLRPVVYALDMAHARRVVKREIERRMQAHGVGTVHLSQLRQQQSVSL